MLIFCKDFVRIASQLHRYAAQQCRTFGDRVSQNGQNIVTIEPAFVTTEWRRRE